MTKNNMNTTQLIENTQLIQENQSLKTDLKKMIEEKNKLKTHVKLLTHYQKWRAGDNVSMPNCKQISKMLQDFTIYLNDK